MDIIRDYIQENGDNVFEVAKKEANQNTVFSIGNDPMGGTMPVALLSVAYGPDNKRSKFRRLEQFLRNLDTQRHAALLGVTERQYISAATTWFDDFYNKNARIIEVTTTGMAPGLSGGMKNALKRRFRDGESDSGVCCPHPDCGFALPRYPGRYPRSCPLCGQNMQEGVKITGAGD